MKKTILLLASLGLVGSLMGCSISLSPALYGPPYYTGPVYYPPSLVVITPIPVEVGPVTIAPSWPYYYGYGGYGYYPRLYHGGYGYPSYYPYYGGGGYYRYHGGHRYRR